MPLVSGCPRCSVPLVAEATCDVHGPVPVLWRSTEADYDGFAELLRLGGGAPTYLPWPMGPGWTVSGFGCVLDDFRPVATVTTTTGTSMLDGEVSVMVVAEEPYVGLGARCAALASDDPGETVGRGDAAVRVRVEQHPVSLWSVPAADAEPLSTAVFAGEAEGRWLWIVLRPASAAFLLTDEWLLRDAGQFGPEAVEMPFGGPPPAW